MKQPINNGKKDKTGKRRIFETGELKEEVVSSILELTTQHGAIAGKAQETKVKYYNLDAIISVGYHVNSSQAKAFLFLSQEFEAYEASVFTNVVSLTDSFPAISSIHRSL
jgi:hypothetical protein